MIQCSCPECGHRYNLADDQAGKSLLCRECKTPFTVKDKPQRPAQDGPAVTKSRPRQDDAEVSRPRRTRRDEDDRDDDDDRPRRRRADEDEDEADERPSKFKGVPPWAWIAGGFAVTLLVLGGVVTVVALAVVGGDDERPVANNLPPAAPPPALNAAPPAAKDERNPGAGAEGQGGNVPPAIDPQPVASMAGQALYDAYASNEVAADLNYTGKRVEVIENYRSQFYAPVKASDGHYYLVLRDSNDWLRGKAAPEPTVVVHFLGSEAESLAHLGDLTDAEDRLVIRGMCRGVAGELQGYRNHVVVRDATLSVRKSDKIRVQVAATLPWQDTGVDLFGSPKVHVIARGGWRKGNATCTGAGFSDLTDPQKQVLHQMNKEYSQLPGETPYRQKLRQYIQEEGEQVKNQAARRPLSKAPLLCLIAKVGNDGPPAAITGISNVGPDGTGIAYNFPLENIPALLRRGRLFLQANDADLQENDGSLDVEITIMEGPSTDLANHKLAAQVEAARKQVEAARRTAEQERQQAIKQEHERKADLESRGQPYYPKPTTLHNGKNAQEWYKRAVAYTLNAAIQKQAAEALVALKEEGMPFLIAFLEQAANPQGVDVVLNLIAPEYVHANDLPKIVTCLDKKRASAPTRMLALRHLRKRKEAKAHAERIEALVADLKASPKYQAEVKETLEAITAAQ